ncbi:hypothetical protein GQ42DRAFT_163595 [Ramicandelaber brevisporus]|nr:hypothetical protein GQ42DRAFT_163595 [Ramicandelaber brevisporus]
MTTERASISGVEPVADHFRLLDLPFDLREYISQFVDRKTAARLLTLSSGFHELLARSVWRCIDKNVFNSNVSNETRTSAFARYGRLVRRVDIQRPLDELDHSIDLSQQLPNVTVYKLDVGNDGSSNEQALHLIKAVSGLHGLRSLEVVFDTYSLQFCLEPLADALVSRQQNQSWQRLQRLKLDFKSYKANCPWSGMADFVAKVTPLQIDDFEIAPQGHSSLYPTAEQIALIAPHLTSVPFIYTPKCLPKCKAHHNSIIYSPQSPSGNGEPVVFSQLEILDVKLCCASSTVHDYVDFTPAKFPRVETMNFYVIKCGRDIMSKDPMFMHPVLSHCWPTVSNMKLHGIDYSSILYSILDLHPQVINLHVETDNFGFIAPQGNHFSLADIVKRLPMLDKLNIELNREDIFYGGSANDANGSEDSDLVYIKNSQLRKILVGSLFLTSGCLEMLYMLPKLKLLMIASCDLDDPEGTLEKFERIKQLNSTMDSGKYGASIESIHFGYIDFEHSPWWSIEMVIAIAAAAPNIYEMGKSTRL